MNSFLSHNASWLRYLTVLLLLPFVMQCRKANEFGLSLAVNADTIRLDTAAGKTHIMVYSTGDWSVAFKKDTNWISIDKTHGHGNSDVVFSYSKNFGPSRTVTLVLTRGSEQKDIVIIQDGISAKFRFSQTKYTIPKQGLKTTLPITGTMQGYYKSVKVEYLYDDETMEKWVTADSVTKDGYVFTSLDNNAGRARSVRIYLTVTDASDNEYTAYTDINQTLSSAYLQQKYSDESWLTKSAKVDTVILQGNVGAQFPLIEKSITYQQGADWIEDVKLTNDSLLLVAVRENTSGVTRKADINLNLTLNGQKIVSLTQHVFQSNSDFDQMSFADLRGLIPAASGSVTIAAPLKAIDGIVVSDEGNPNMETNTQTGFKTIDLEETYRTAYVESEDGKYGFRLKFVSKSENILKRYSKVTISVDGLNLEKEAAPARYTISGVKAADIVSNEAGSAADLPGKQKSIGELTDDDMYTFVTLKDVSIAVPYGSYMNVNRGYSDQTTWNTKGTTAPYVDAIPTCVYDRQGDHMNLLVNASAPWAVTTLSPNSGTISGILTHSELLRYGGGNGDIGTYQLRPVDEHDVKLDDAPVATTLVEWNWMKGGTNTCAAGTVVKDPSGKVLPFVGTGTLSCTAAGATPTAGWNPVCHSDPDSKTAYNNGCQYANVKWWDAANNRGEGYVLQFSTSGLSAQSVLLNFSINGGSGSDASIQVPVYWAVEYSFDGSNYAAVPGGDFVVRPLVQWNTDRPFESPGLTPYSFRLPASILGHGSVYIKLVPTSDVCATGSPTGAENGHVTASMAGTTVRVGNISVKYIK